MKIQITKSPNQKDLGGVIQTKGSNFSNGLTIIGAGGTHEQNENQGVQIGTDNQGVPNLVEEGEVIYDDYVFSNRLTVPNYRKQYKKKSEAPYEVQVLWNYSGNTFADTAKKIEKNSGIKDRPNDKIARDGMKAALEVTAGVQEKEREKEKLREMQETIDNMSPEEFAAMQQQQEMQQAAQQQAEQQAVEQMQQQPTEEELAMLQQQQVAQEQTAQQQAMQQGQPMAAYGGKLFEFGGTLADFDKELANRGLTRNDYFKYLLANGDIDEVQYGFYTSPSITDMSLTESNFNKDLAEQYLNSLKSPAVTGPLADVIKKEGLTDEKWNKLSDKQKRGYINQYKDKLGKQERKTFETNLNNYNQQQAYIKQVQDYRTTQGNSNLTLDDIKDLTYEQKVKLGKAMNKDFDTSKYNTPNKQKEIDNDLVQLSKSNNLTLGKLNEMLAPSTSYEDWQIVDPETAWKDTKEYDWSNPLYGGAHDVVQGNAADKWEARKWGDENGFTVGKTPYANMKEYELSDAYLKPRYELAKSAAAADEEGKKLWNSYVTDRLNSNYKYDPNILFGKDYTNHLQGKDEEEGYQNFKKYITDNYDKLNKTSGFFDQIAGQLHGTYALKKNRELYQMENNKGTYLTPEENWQNNYELVNTETKDGTTTYTLRPKAGLMFTRATMGMPEGIQYDDKTGQYKSTVETEGNDTFPKASTWPYLAGIGLQGASLLYNWLTPADYSNASAMIKAAQSAGVYNPIEFRPIGNYLSYKPLDIWYEQNRLNANARATDRAILNSGANQGSKAAALLASGYNNQLASGNLFRQALEYNDALRKQVGEFNKDTDKFNSEGFLKADMANQDAATRARGYQLEGLKSGYAMMQDIDAAKANAISAGISGLANLAMAYGQNKWNNDVLGWKLQHNQYPVSQLEGYKYDPYTGKPVLASKGGKLKKRHRGLGF